MKLNYLFEECSVINLCFRIGIFNRNRINYILNSYNRLLGDFMVICQKCGSENEESSIFCFNCGEKLKTTANLCPKCGVVNSSQAKFCIGCGMKLKKDPN